LACFLVFFLVARTPRVPMRVMVCSLVLSRHLFCFWCMTRAARDGELGQARAMRRCGERGGESEGESQGEEKRRDRDKEGNGSPIPINAFYICTHSHTLSLSLSLSQTHTLASYIIYQYGARVFESMCVHHTHTHTHTHTLSLSLTLSLSPH